MAHLGGHKVWIVWPPTEYNLRAIRDHMRVLGPTRELRLARWLQYLQEPEVFLTRAGDSFFLGPSVIHACISITNSAHFGIYCWRRESLDVAQLNLRILQEGYEDFAKVLTEQRKRRQKEDKEKNVSVERHRNREEDRQLENAHAQLCLEFYQSCKTDWNQNDGQVWRTITMSEQDKEIDKWIPVVEKFMGQIKSRK